MDGNTSIVGIDEAGRGPIAGPVTVATFSCTNKKSREILKKIFFGKLRDSKKLSSKNREIFFGMLNAMKKRGEVDFAVSHSTAKMIDSKGIIFAIQYALNRALSKMGAHTSTHIRLDGSLKAPSSFFNQKTIIKGDEKDIFIACASIVAKVSRDRLLTRLSKKFPRYGFEIHKGYGTSSHRALIVKHGLTPIHRKSFCRGL